MGENDQVVRTVPNTDLGGHDTAGVDGEKRTERSGEILGTPNPDDGTIRHTEAGRELETRRADFVTQEVDRANREDLPRLGGNITDEFTEEKGGPPEFLDDAAKSKAKNSKAAGGVTTANVAGTAAAPARTTPAPVPAPARREEKGR